jgi:hypothetical protein
MKTKIISTIVVLLAQIYFWVLPVQNSTAVDQLKDTVTSTANVTLMTTFFTYSPIVTLALILLIWSKELKTMFIK